MGWKRELDDCGVDMSDWLEYWRNYRKTTGELTWRLAVPDDLPAIKRLQSRSARLLRAKQRRIDIFRFPVMLALVAEDKSGKIVDCLILEAQVEVSKVGCDTQSFMEASGLAQDLLNWLHQQSIRKVFLALSRPGTPQQEQMLEETGFRCTGVIFRRPV